MVSRFIRALWMEVVEIARQIREAKMDTMVELLAPAT